MHNRKRSSQQDPLEHDPVDLAKENDYNTMNRGIQIPMVLFKSLSVGNHSLPHYRGAESCLWYIPKKPAFHESAFLTGHLMRTMKCKGANRRTVAFLISFMQSLAAIKPYRFSQHSTEKHIKTMTERTVAFFKQCRPHNIATGNTIRWVKENLLPECYNTTCKRAVSHMIALQQFSTDVLFYIRERFALAQTNIAKAVCDFVADSECLDVCTFGLSTAVMASIIALHKKVKILKVYCINDAPLNEGTEMAQILAEFGILVKVVPISDVNILIPRLREECIFLLGAVSLATNGTILSRAGSSISVTSFAENGIPVLALCSTAKFSPRCLVDPYGHNELYDPAWLTTRFKDISLQMEDSYKPEKLYDENYILHIDKYVIPEKESFTGATGDKWRTFTQSQMRRDTRERMCASARRDQIKRRMKDVVLGRYLDGGFRVSLTRPVPLDLNDGECLKSAVMRIDDKLLYYKVLSTKVPVKSIVSFGGVEAPIHVGSVNSSSRIGGISNSGSAAAMLGGTLMRTVGDDDPPRKSSKAGRLSIGYAELGQPIVPQALVPIYDLTTPEFITTVVTEIGMIDPRDASTLLSKRHLQQTGRYI